MSVNASYSPISFAFGIVPPNTDGPNISIDPSFGPPGISFAGGIEIKEAPVSDLISARIEDDAAGIFRIRDLIVMEWVMREVDPSELPHGHHGPLPKVKVLEIVSQREAQGTMAVSKGQFFLVRLAYATPAEPLDAQKSFTATAVIQGGIWNQIRVPLSLQLGLVLTSFTSPPLVITQGQQAGTPILLRSLAGEHTSVSFEMSLTQLHTGITLLHKDIPLDPGESRPDSLSFRADPQAPIGQNILAIDQFSLNQRHGLLLEVNVLPAAHPPPPDPRAIQYDAIHVEGSTHRICQLTGGGDPEGKPHLNDTTRFALLGTDLGSSFDHFVNGEHRTYFFFGDTQTDRPLFGDGDQDGDAIAFTTDDKPIPDGIHLQFIMGDNQWRRLVIPGITLGNFEVPTGGFSHDGRIFVFAATEHRKIQDKDFMEKSVLASALDAHNNFDLAYVVSTRDDTVDTPNQGGKFINVAPWKIKNNDWPGLPDNAQPDGEGLLLVGSGCYRQSAAYLAYVPLRPGEPPHKQDWRYLSGFLFMQPGSDPNGTPNWSTNELEASQLFDGQIGEISFSWHAGLKRWLIVYGGCAPDGCGIVLRSAPTPWGRWSDPPQLIFKSARDDPNGKFMFECGPYGAYIIGRYDEWNPALQEATFYFTLSNGNCNGDPHEPRYQVHLMKTSLKLVRK